MQDIINMGMKVMQSISYFPGIQNLMNTTDLTNLYLILGWVCVGCYIATPFIIAFGALMYGIKKGTTDAEGNSNTKKPKTWLTGGLIGGAFTALAPTIFIIVGAIIQAGKVS